MQRFVEEGTYRPLKWCEMTLISQVWWGAVFCLPAGFSFTALRLSTLVISLLGIEAFYLLVRQLGRPRWLAMVVALVLAFNPIYFGLSYTFMTDVPFVVLAVLTSLAFLVSLRSQSRGYWILGTCLSTAAILCRQLGLFLPLAFGLTVLIRHGISRRTLFRATIPVAIGVGAFLLLSVWLTAKGATPGNYASRPLSIVAALTNVSSHFQLAVRSTGLVLLYLGMFLFPLLLVVFPGLLEEQTARQRRYTWATFLLTAMGTIGGLIWFQRVLPNGSILCPTGIGPTTLPDISSLKFVHIPPLPPWFWTTVAIVGTLGCGMAAAALFSMLVNMFARRKAFRKDEDLPTSLFFLAGAAIYLLPVIVSCVFFDRYILPVMVLFAGALVVCIKSEHLPSNCLLRRTVVGLVCGMSAFSIVGTRDYLAWSRARWDAVRYLTELKHVRPTQIDGGFEFNGLYLYEAKQQQLEAWRKSGGTIAAPLNATDDWYWLFDDEYLVTFGERPGYDVIHQVGFTRWMPFGEKAIFVLHRHGRAF